MKILEPIVIAIRELEELKTKNALGIMVFRMDGKVQLATLYRVSKIIADKYNASLEENETPMAVTELYDTMRGRCLTSRMIRALKAQYSDQVGKAVLKECKLCPKMKKALAASVKKAKDDARDPSEIPGSPAATLIEREYTAEFLAQELKAWAERTGSVPSMGTIDTIQAKLDREQEFSARNVRDLKKAVPDLPETMRALSSNEIMVHSGVKTSDHPLYKWKPEGLEQAFKTYLEGPPKITKAEALRKMQSWFESHPGVSGSIGRSTLARVLNSEKHFSEKGRRAVLGTFDGFERDYVNLVRKEINDHPEHYPKPHPSFLNKHAPPASGENPASGNAPSPRLPALAMSNQPTAKRSRTDANKSSEHLSSRDHFSPDPLEQHQAKRLRTEPGSAHSIGSSQAEPPSLGSWRRGVEEYDPLPLMGFGNGYDNGGFPHPYANIGTGEGFFNLAFGLIPQDQELNLSGEADGVLPSAPPLRSSANALQPRADTSDELLFNFSHSVFGQGHGPQVTPGILPSQPHDMPPPPAFSPEEIRGRETEEEERLSTFPADPSPSSGFPPSLSFNHGTSSESAFPPWHPPQGMPPVPPFFPPNQEIAGMGSHASVWPPGYGEFEITAGISPAEAWALWHAWNPPPPM